MSIILNKLSFLTTFYLYLELYIRQAMVEILDVLQNKKILAEIILADKVQLPLKKHKWNFNWRQISKHANTTTYGLRLLETAQTVEGVLQVRVEGDMYIMDLIEIAPHNIGSNKTYELVAECLISFACRESFNIDGDYKGFLTFVSKTDLIEWYSSKYGAIQAMGQRMYITPEKGLELINKYLTI